MTHKALIKQPIAKVATELKKKGRVIDTAKSENIMGEEVVYTTCILNHRLFILIEKNQKPVSIKVGKSDNALVITKHSNTDDSMCYDQWKQEIHGY